MKENRKFLTEDVDLLFCNNFNEVFGFRSSDQENFDSMIAGLLTQLKPGAKLITLSALPCIFPPIDHANEELDRNGLPRHENASFYTFKTVQEEGMAEDRLNFTHKPFEYFIYERVGSATFLCNNPHCDIAKDRDAIQAYEINNKGKENERLVPVNVCPLCMCRQQPRRSTRAINPSYVYA